jgi:hypothetical protein
LAAAAEEAERNHSIEWVDAYDLTVRHCVGCMRCRPDGECVLPSDDGHVMGRKIKEAGGLIIGTPVHWGNMSAPLKMILDRNVPVFMGEKPSGLPEPRQKGKRAVLATACTTPWPFNFIFAESRGAFRSLGEVLHYGGIKTIAKIAQPDTKKHPGPSDKTLARARRAGAAL